MKTERPEPKDPNGDVIKSAITGFNFTPTLHQKAAPSLESTSQTLPSPFVVCVIGASRGIDAETAKAFAQAGPTGLILTARTLAALDETKQTCKRLAKISTVKISALAADAGSEAAAERVAAVIQEEHGRLDALIINAGLVATNPSAFSKFDAIDVSQVQEMMQLNYIGRFALIKHLIPLLLSSPNGAKAIVDITSLASHFTTEGVGALGFNISAPATNRLTEAVATTYGPEGAFAYAVHPGAVRTSPPPGMPKDVLELLTDDPGLCGAFLVWLVKKSAAG
ncbi:hypothetical protein H2203_005182 [Taxawa tesnikishii (nom. ined.)]|nr:hypothetical protein H2203_005182 [Dothideales sp. JES 119]